MRNSINVILLNMARIFTAIDILLETNLLIDKLLIVHTRNITIEHLNMF